MLLYASQSTFYPFSGPAPVVSSRERYLRALEHEQQQEFEATPSAGPSTSRRSSGPVDFGAWSVVNVQPSHIDGRGRQTDFKETVRQRQERLEFLRRQEFARRLALKGLTHPAASIYVEVRAPIVPEYQQSNKSDAYFSRNVYLLRVELPRLNEFTPRPKFNVHSVLMSQSKKPSPTSHLSRGLLTTSKRRT